MAEIPAEAVRLAAEAIEEVAIRRLGRDLGTTSRDEIVEAGLRAALPLLVQAGREAAARAVGAAALGLTLDKQRIYEHAARLARGDNQVPEPRDLGGQQ